MTTSFFQETGPQEDAKSEGTIFCNAQAAGCRIVILDYTFSRNPEKWLRMDFLRWEALFGGQGAGFLAPAIMPGTKPISAS